MIKIRALRSSELKQVLSLLNQYSDRESEYSVLQKMQQLYIPVHRLSLLMPLNMQFMPAIFIAAGAGLEVARGLLFPGLLPRGASLARAGGRASRLLLGSIPLLLVAGTIEGFFSPTNAPVVMKFSLAAVLFTGLVLYLFGAGKKD